MDDDLNEDVGGVVAEASSEAPESSAETAPAPGFDTRPKRPRSGVWVVMGALVIGALAFGFLREDVLYEEDFSTPDALRTWPYGEPQYDYVDGAYHLTSSGGVPASAYHDLPGSVGAISIRVAMETLTGAPSAILQCASSTVEDDLAGTVEVTDGYIFGVAPEGGDYAIVYGDEILDEGVLPSATEVTVGCASDGTTTTLTIDVPGHDGVEVTHDGGASSFKGIALAAWDERGTGTIAFDDLKVTGA